MAPFSYTFKEPLFAKKRREREQKNLLFTVAAVSRKEIQTSYKGIYGAS